MNRRYRITALIFSWCLFISLGAPPAVPVPAQEDNSELLFSCSYSSGVTDDDCIPDNVGFFSGGDLSMATLIGKIIGTLRADSTAKVPYNFVTYECNFPQPVFKAITKKKDTTRYILYTKKQLEELMKTQTNWVAFSIFAHEIAHHLYGHSLSNYKNAAHSRQREIEADFFCGYVLRKMSATLSDAQSGINAIDNHPTDEFEEFSTHPTKAKRLTAIDKGYELSGLQGSTTSTLLNIDSLRKTKSMEQLFNKTLEAFFDKDFQKALKMLDELNIAWNGKNQSDYFNLRGTIKKEQGHNKEAIKDFNKAINLNKNHAQYFFNRSEIRIESKNKKIQELGKEDLKIALELEKAKISTFKQFQ